ncbi:MAG: orotidine 5'-phosphate decarboxylase [Deltaproteobacteria bacterium RBG_16_64_85]|nr:MAG: orotidine 5'-phosphate decarboxylase [Deltaproteobacteria bacterium RBG_16_64_85]
MKERIIVALDTDSPEAALAAVSALAGEVGLFKVGMELFPRGGPELVERIRATGAEVFLDLKFHDIPNTVAGAVRSAVALGVKFATVHASGGKAMLAAAAAAAEGSGTTLLAVTVLTSLDDADLSSVGFALRAAEAVDRLAGLAVDAGIGGIVCSAKEVAAVRARVGKEVVLVTPGVRLPEDSVGDQKRVVTPFEAVRAGANYIVVGRPITKASDPVAAARKFASEMRRTL